MPITFLLLEMEPKLLDKLTMMDPLVFFFNNGIKALLQQEKKLVNRDIKIKLYLLNFHMKPGNQ